MSNWRWCLIFVISVMSARAHVVTQIFGEWKQPARTWQIDVLFDAGYAIPELRGDASAAAPQREWLIGLGESGWAPLRVEAERYLRESLAVRSGGKTAGWKVRFVDFETSPPDFSQLLNDGAYFRIQLIGAEPLEAGSEIRWAGGGHPSLVMRMPEGKYLTVAPGQTIGLPTVDQPGHAAWWEAFLQGYLHVLPYGLDHVLFLLGLFLYERKWRPLFEQSLAFTVAHTVTLGLAAAGMVRVPGFWVEPWIALSISVVAVGSLRAHKRRNRRGRLAVVFGFGLIHGLGFAGALSVWLKPGAGFLTSLLSANVGVEAAQATLLSVAWHLTTRWNQTSFYPKFKAAACVLIAITGLLWMFQRLGVF